LGFGVADGSLPELPVSDVAAGAAGVVVDVVDVVVARVGVPVASAGGGVTVSADGALYALAASRNIAKTGGKPERGASLAGLSSGRPSAAADEAGGPTIEPTRTMAGAKKHMKQPFSLAVFYRGANLYYQSADGVASRPELRL
jgi:hypothetical protein